MKKNNEKKVIEKRKSPGVKQLENLQGKYIMQKTNSKNAKKKENRKEEYKPLTHNEILFCEKYLETQNTTQSYLYMKPNVKESTAAVEGCKLLKKPNIKKYIKERLKPIQEEEEKKAIADANEILEFITAVIRGEVKDQLGFETSVKDRLAASKMLADRYKLFEKPKDPDEEKEEEEKNKSKVIIEVVDNSNLEKVLYENK